MVAFDNSVCGVAPAGSSRLAGGDPMSPLLISVLCLTMVGTSFLSGIFGMAGGMILMGVLLVLLPVPEAMMLHGVTQMASNGWRGLLWWRHAHWRAGRRPMSSACCIAIAGLVVLALRAEQAGRVPDARADAVHHLAGAEEPAAEPGESLAVRGAGPAQHDADAADRRVRSADRHVLPQRQDGPARDRRHQGDVPDRQPRRQARLFRRADRPGGVGRSAGRGARHRRARWSAPSSPPTCSKP